MPTRRRTDTPNLFADPQKPDADKAFRDSLRRNTDPVTSQDAAAAIAPNVDSIREQVFQLYVGFGPMTHDAAIARYRDAYDPDVKESTVRTRVHELVIASRLIDTGDREKRDGRAATVWGLHRSHV